MELVGTGFTLTAWWSWSHLCPCVPLVALWAQAAPLWEEGVQESDSSQDTARWRLGSWNSVLGIILQLKSIRFLSPGVFPCKEIRLFSPERIPHLTGRADTNYRYWGEQREEMSCPWSLGLSVVGGTLFIQKAKFSLWCWWTKCSKGTKIPLQQLSDLSGLKSERLDSLGKFNGKRCFAFAIGFIWKSLWGFWG